MEHIIAVSMPGETLFAGPVIETRTTARQDLYTEPVTIPQEDAERAFDWALDDATEGAEEHGIVIQVRHIVDGQVIEYGIALP